MNTSFLKFGRALLFAALSISAGSALATPNFGTRLDNWCALRPIQSSPPQQSRPYRAANFSCSLCHNTNSPSSNDLNARGNASLSCNGTTCGTAVNNFCVATPPTASAIAIASPPAGTVVAQGQPVTFTAGGTSTSPDGFLLGYTWLFSNGLPSADGFSVTVPMNAVGSVTSTLQVRNSVGMLATGTPPTRTITVTGAANQPPTATIGAPAGNVTIAQGGSVNFTGSGNDPDGNTPLTYSWNFGGGAANSTQQNPGAVTFNSAGTFTVTFTVTDSLGLSSTAVTRTITVTSPSNQPPTATIGAPTGNVTVAQGGTVNFTGSGNDPDGNTPLTYSWNFGGGAANSTAQNPGAVTFNTAGTFTVTFTVTDSLGLSSTAVTRIVTVTGVGGQQPVAIIDEPNQNRTIARGKSVEFHAKANNTDDEDDELRFNWSFPGGTPTASTRDEVKVFFNTAGIFTVTLTVTDSQGRTSAPVSRVITVTGPANIAPTATMDAPAGDVTILQGGTVNFMGTGADPDGNLPLSYSWDFGGGAANSTEEDPGAVMFDTAGSFVVTFTVTDSEGLASEPATRTVTVNPADMPVAGIVEPAMNVSVLPRGKVSFKGAAVGIDNPRFSWTFQGGNPKKSNRQNPGEVRFDKVGTHLVTLTVTDGTGVSLTPVTRVITVARPNASPRVDDDCLDDRKRGDRDHDRDDDRKRDRDD